MKNKILPILCIFILISFIFINNCFAVSLGSINGSSYKFFIPDVPYNKFITLEEYTSGNYDYFIQLSDGTCHVYFFEKNSGIEIRVTTSRTFYSNYESLTDFKCIYYGINETSGAISGPSARTTFANSSSPYGYWSSGNNLYFYTNLESYSVDGSSDFFFVAPLMETPELPETTETVEIPAVETVEQIPEVMVTTLKLIIPIGLVILSVVLVIYLTRRLIYRSL